MPCSRRRRSRAARSGSGVMIIPPSPVVSSLRGWKENAARLAPAPSRAAVVGRPGRAGSVLHHGDATRVAQRPHRVEVRRDAGLVHQDHRARALGQQRLDRGRGEVQRRRVHVGEHRLGADVACRVRGGDEGQRGNDDLVSGADARRDHGQVQACRAGGDRHGVPGADWPRRTRPRTPRPAGPGQPSRT